MGFQPLIFNGFTIGGNGGGGGSGTVTSVGLSLPNIFTITNSPVTTTGTLTGTFASQSQNLVFASPNGSSGVPTFRSLVAADIPTLSYLSTTLGTANGLSVSTNTLSLGLSSTSTTGALSSTDWNTFNNKISGPGGLNTQIQFNDSGSFNGTAGLVFDKTNVRLGINQSSPKGRIHANSATTSGTVNVDAIILGRPDSTSNIGPGATILGGNSSPNIASGQDSFASGSGTTASSAQAHAEGNGTTAGANYSHAEGLNTLALSNAAHAEGNSTVANNANSHAEGLNTQTNANNAHAEGSSTNASGLNSHAEGSSTVAAGNNSHSAGVGTDAEADDQTAVGSYNILVGTPGSPLSTDELFTVGNGTSNGARATAFSIRRDGLINAHSHLISNVLDPVSNQDAVTLAYFNAHSGVGSVTSVALADSTGLFNITGSPVTSTGTLTLASFQSQAQHSFFAAPSGSTGAPTFRAIVASDVPTLNQNTTGTASNITASSNSTLTTLSSLSLPASQLTGTLAAGQFPALTGDITTSAGSLTTTLANVASAGTTGSSTAIPVITINAKGLTTSITTAAVVAPAGTLSGTTLNSTVVTSSLTSLGTQSANLNMGSHKITSVTDPTLAQDAATKAYVDNVAAGINPAVAVQAATTAAGNTSALTYNNGVAGIGATLTGANNTALTIDGYTFTALGQRLLVKNDTQSPSGAFNGVYYVTQVQALALPLILTRALDYDTPSDINNTGTIPVINGTVNGTTQWVLTSLVNTVGTDPLTFTQFARNPADYLLKANNLSDVSSKSSSFDNLSPMTTGGDLIYGGASGTGTRLANGSSGQVLTSNGGTAAPSWQTTINGLVASGYIASAAGADIALTSATLASFGTNVNIPSPTLEFNPGSGTLDTSTNHAYKFKITNLTAGYYRVSFDLNIASGSAGTYITLAINDGTSTTGWFDAFNGSSYNPAAHVEGHFHYTSTADQTFELFGAASSSSVVIQNSGSLQRVYFSITKVG